MLVALKFVASSDESKFMICSDSLSSLLAIESCKTQNHFVLNIVEIYKSLVSIGTVDGCTRFSCTVSLGYSTVSFRNVKIAVDLPGSDIPENIMHQIEYSRYMYISNDTN
jgi:hypothetical protein